MSDETPIEEGLLLARWRAGDRAAAEALVLRHQGPVMGFLLSMCGGARDLAEDLLQETFLRVLEGSQGFYDERGRFRAYLFHVARNLCVDDFRRRARRPAAAEGVLEALPAGEQTDPERAALAEQRAEAVRRALALLPAEQREVVLLRHYAGLSFREIADVQGCLLGTCLGRMHYALKHLKRLVPQEEWAHGL